MMAEDFMADITRKFDPQNSDQKAAAKVNDAISAYLPCNVSSDEAKVDILNNLRRQQQVSEAQSLMPNLDVNQCIDAVMKKLLQLPNGDCKYSQRRPKAEVAAINIIRDSLVSVRTRKLQDQRAAAHKHFMACVSFYIKQRQNEADRSAPFNR